LQLYRCSQCGKKFSDRKDFGWIGHKQDADEGASLLALRLLVEGNSVRSAARISGLDKKTIPSLLAVAGEKCERLIDGVVQNVPVNDVQADEIWSYCEKKKAAPALEMIGPLAMRGALLQSSAT
jgi:lambda repressor-like predicted transcriptional regulator